MPLIHIKKEDIWKYSTLIIISYYDQDNINININININKY